jgi:hypothetical protein
VPASSRSRTTQPGAPTARDVLREIERRSEILKEHFLRQDVARFDALRRENPTLWREVETGRRARNRDTAALNRRLRAEGLSPVELEPSLAQRVKKLKQIEARERARTALHEQKP